MQGFTRKDFLRFSAASTAAVSAGLGNATGAQAAAAPRRAQGLAVIASTLHEVVDVEQARSLAAARKAIALRRPDIVVLDLGLPDGSGLDLLEELSDEKGRAIPVVVYSAQDMDAALKGGVDAVLTKSRVSLTTLMRTVRRLTINREAVGPDDQTEHPSRRR